MQRVGVLGTRERPRSEDLAHDAVLEEDLDVRRILAFDPLPVAAHHAANALGFGAGEMHQHVARMVTRVDELAPPWVSTPARQEPSRVGAC